MTPSIERNHRKCSYSACNEKALFYPIITVWAKGFPKTSVPLKMEIGMQFCKAHSEEFKMADIPELDKISQDVCKEYKKLPPDFSTAELSMTPLIII